MHQRYDGRCHCGDVRFSALIDLDDAYTCDCSMCARKGSIACWVTEPEGFSMEVSGELKEYRFNKQIARHFFCARCGVHTFHHTRRQPQVVSVNIRCLEGVDLDALRPREVHGSRLD